MISYTTPIAESNSFIVLDKYTKEWQVNESYQSEGDLEREFIQDLQNQGYEYLLGLNTPEKLLANVREQLQSLNNMQFSDGEWLRFAETWLDKPSDTIIDKTSLLVDFINQTDLDTINDKATVIDAFFTFAQAEQQREAEALISSENLYTEAAKRYISTSLKREFASDNGTELNTILPKMSPLNPQYLTKKQSVFQKIAAFVEKFKGVGWQI